MDGLLDIGAAMAPRALAAGMLLAAGHRSTAGRLRRNTWLMGVSLIAGLTIADRLWPSPHDELYTIWAALCVAIGGIVPAYATALILDRKAVLVRNYAAVLTDDTPPLERASTAVVAYLAIAAPAALLLCYGLRPLLIR